MCCLLMIKLRSAFCSFLQSSLRFCERYPDVSVLELGIVAGHQDKKSIAESFEVHEPHVVIVGVGVSSDFQRRVSRIFQQLQDVVRAHDSPTTWVEDAKV